MPTIEEARANRYKCKSANCGGTFHPDINMDAPEPHYAEAKCFHCKTHLFWISKPTDKKTKRPAAHKALAKKYSRGFCELCLIRESHIPNGESLHAHHVIQYKDGGDSGRDNIQIVCTACHSLIHWRRTYLSHTVGLDGRVDSEDGIDTGAD